MTKVSKKRQLSENEKKDEVLAGAIDKKNVGSEVPKKKKKIDKSNLVVNKTNENSGQPKASQGKPKNPKNKQNKKQKNNQETEKENGKTTDEGELSSKKGPRKSRNYKIFFETLPEEEVVKRIEQITNREKISKTAKQKLRVLKGRLRALNGEMPSGENGSEKKPRIVEQKVDKSKKKSEQVKNLSQKGKKESVLFVEDRKGDKKNKKLLETLKEGGAQKKLGKKTCQD